MVKLEKRIYMELLCVVDSVTHGVFKLTQTKQIGGGKYTVQPVTYCDTDCGFCDVHAHAMDSRNDTKITCDVCKAVITEAHTKGDGI